MFLKWMNCAWKKSLQCVCGVGWGEGVGCLGSREWILCINPTRPKLHSLRECIHYFLKHNALKIQKSIIYSGIFSYCNTSMQTLIWSFALCLKRNFLLKKNINFSSLTVSPIFYQQKDLRRFCCCDLGMRENLDLVRLCFVFCFALLVFVLFLVVNKTVSLRFQCK